MIRALVQPEVDLADVGSVIARARLAHCQFRKVDQEGVDSAVRALADRILSADVAERLAALSVRLTGLGHAADRASALCTRTRRLADELLDLQSVGPIAHDARRGITSFARPAGVAVALVDAVDPLLITVELALRAIKARSPIVFTASPAAAAVVQEVTGLLREALGATPAAPDMIQVLAPPVSIERTRALLRLADVVTGAPARHHDRLLPARPVSGHGGAAVPVIVDDSADPVTAAAAIARSKTRDNGAACTAETVLLATEAVFEPLLRALEEEGGRLLAPEEIRRAAGTLWRNGKLNRTLIGKDARILAIGLGLPPRTQPGRFLVAVEPPDAPAGLPAQPLSLVLAVRRVADFATAASVAAELLSGAGASGIAVIHTRVPGRPEALASALDAGLLVHNEGIRAALDDRLLSALPMSAPMGRAGELLGPFLGVTRLLVPIDGELPSSAGHAI